MLVELFEFRQVPFGLRNKSYVLFALLLKFCGLKKINGMFEFLGPP